MDETTASLWRDAITLPVGHTQAFGARVADVVAALGLEEALALGDHALALLAAERVVCLEFPLSSSGRCMHTAASRCRGGSTHRS
jgi:hypothetical protein